MDENKIKELIEKGRAALRSGYEEDPYPDYQTDQQLKKPQPPLVKEAMSDHIIDLPIDFEGIEVSRLTSRPSSTGEAPIASTRRKR